VDHIHYAPVLFGIYDKAEKKYFDPYEIGMRIALYFSRFLNVIDRAIDWVYDVAAVQMTVVPARVLSLAHSGNYSAYVVWALLGAALIAYLGLR
jgi:NADH-quinone oxidoreductase subunit L